MANRVIRFKAAAFGDLKVLNALVQEGVTANLVDQKGLVFEAGDGSGEEFPLLVPALRAGGFSYDHHGDGVNWGADTGQWKTHRASTGEDHYHHTGIGDVPPLASEPK
ncbi:MAG: hypothetical protein BGP10_04270 [Rhodanobacter sp. 68-29]|nr:hypothetical protein [Rhodanobacter sp.]OJY61725.1 MAG: hypothetical protein BGP10_04270 [Rhodanobacter sp. 68-29]